MPYKTHTENEADTLAEREAEYSQLKLALHLAQSDRQHYIDEMQSAMSKMKYALHSQIYFFYEKTQ